MLPNPLLTTAGHRNALGLTDAGQTGVKKLLDEGMILDLAHMGDKSREDVLNIADTCQRPVIDSHTALRLDLNAVAHATDPERREVSERDLSEAHAMRISKNGGMIGLGTSKDLQPIPLFHTEGEPLERMGNPLSDINLVQEQTWLFNEPHLRIALHTGKDDMRGQDDIEDVEVHAKVTYADNTTSTSQLLEYRDGDLRLIDTFESWSYDWVTVPLKEGVRAEDVKNLELSLIQDADGLNADNWDLKGIEVYYIGREGASLLYSESNTGPNDGDVVRRFSKSIDADHPENDGPTWNIPLSPDRSHKAAVLELWTGGDDLRCDSYATLNIAFADQTSWSDDFEQRVSPRDGLGNNSYFERPLALPGGKTLQDVANVSLQLSQDDPRQDCGITITTLDNWNLDRMRLSTPEVSRIVAVDRNSGPFFRFTNNSQIVVVAGDVTRERPFRSLLLNTDGTRKDIMARFLRVAVRTGDDDIVYGSNATGSIFDTNGATVAKFDLNQGSKWSDRSDHWTVVDLGSPHRLIDLAGITISFDPAAGPNGVDEEWKIRGVDVEAIGSPMATWWAEYQHASDLLGGRGLAIGTDLNGFQPQIPYSEITPTYPLTFPTAPAGAVTPPTIKGPQTAGDRTFDFVHEGISNVGQLPEFVTSVGMASGSIENAAPLFRSAEDFVTMWEKIDALAKVPTNQCTR